MEAFITDFIRAVQKRIDKKKFDCTFLLHEAAPNCYSDSEELLYKVTKLPQSVGLFYSYVKYLNILRPRSLELLSLSTMYCIDDRYIVFSKIKDMEIIAFDLNSYNKIEDEFDIVCLSNKFVITKTFPSFITNKVWAWIDRGRIVWEKELYVRGN